MGTSLHESTQCLTTISRAPSFDVYTERSTKAMVGITSRDVPSQIETIAGHMNGGANSDVMKASVQRPSADFIKE